MCNPSNEDGLTGCNGAAGLHRSWWRKQYHKAGSGALKMHACCQQLMCVDLVMAPLEVQFGAAAMICTSSQLCGLVKSFWVSFVSLWQGD